MIKIAPSILSADFANLEKEVKALEQAGADMIHIDVMDGHFVPNLTIGSEVIKAIRKHTTLPLDVHLMINSPERSIDQYIDAGANIITIHYESTLHIDRILNQIRQANVGAGISLLPSTAPEVIDYIISKLDMILVMTVNPGFGGQTFIKDQLGKIKILSEKIKQIDHPIILAVDGGINESIAPWVIDAGADLLVSGSYVFSGSYEQQIMKLKSGK